MVRLPGGYTVQVILEYKADPVGTGSARGDGGRVLKINAYVMRAVGRVTIQ